MTLRKRQNKNNEDAEKDKEENLDTETESTQKQAQDATDDARGKNAVTSNQVLQKLDKLSSDTNVTQVDRDFLINEMT